MASIQNKVIHRFIRPIEDYQVGGSYFTQIIPTDTQAYAYYPEDSEQAGLWYVFGDGNHTYLEIKEGKGDLDSAKEYPVLTSDVITIINNKADKENTYTKEEVDTLLENFSTFHIEIVNELPVTGEENVLYLVPNPDHKEEEEDNWYYEYLWTNNKWELIGNTKGGGSIDPEDLKAEKIEYTYGSIKNVKEALDLLMSYEPTIVPGENEVEEVGSTLKDVTLSWNVNKPLQSITIKPGDIQVDPTAKSYTIKDANLDETTTYTIYLNDGKNTYTTEQTFTFASKLYNGTSSKQELDNQEILDFNQVFDVDKETKTYNFNCDGGKYFFLCIPSEKANSVTFKINGFIFTDFIETRMELTNASGYTKQYSIFRCNNLQHGSDIPVEIIYNE